MLPTANGAHKGPFCYYCDLVCVRACGMRIMGNGKNIYNYNGYGIGLLDLLGSL